MKLYTIQIHSRYLVKFIGWTLSNALLFVQRLPLHREKIHFFLTEKMFQQILMWFFFTLDFLSTRFSPYLTHGIHVPGHMGRREKIWNFNIQPIILKNFFFQQDSYVQSKLLSWKMSVYILFLVSIFKHINRQAHQISFYIRKDKWKKEWKLDTFLN